MNKYYFRDGCAYMVIAASTFELAMFKLVEKTKHPADWSFIEDKSEIADSTGFVPGTPNHDAALIAAHG
jgi:hypothetical protein